MYMVTGRYKIFGDGLQLYGDVMYSQGEARQRSGWRALPLTRRYGRNEARASIQSVRQNLNSVRYRSQQELADRRSFFDKDYYRYVAGINGDFNFADNNFISRFGYDAGFVYERFEQQRIDSGDLRSSYQSISVGFTKGTLFGSVHRQFDRHSRVQRRSEARLRPNERRPDRLTAAFDNSHARRTGPTVAPPTSATRSSTSATASLTPSSTPTSSRNCGTVVSTSPPAMNIGRRTRSRSPILCRLPTTSLASTSRLR